MAAILVYIPGGKINKWAYEGALQQVEAIKEEFKGNIIDLGSIGIPEFYRMGDEVSESVHQQASKFVVLAKSGQNVIARINARSDFRSILFPGFRCPDRSGFASKTAYHSFGKAQAHDRRRMAGLNRLDGVYCSPKSQRIN